MKFNDGIDEFGENLDLQKQPFVLKLDSGSTIICMILENSDKGVLVQDPFEINIVRSQQAEGIRAITYYSEWFEDSSQRIHIIRKEHVVSCGVPKKSMGNHYMRLVARKILTEKAAETKAKLEAGEPQKIETISPASIPAATTSSSKKNIPESIIKMLGADAPDFLKNRLNGPN